MKEKSIEVTCPQCQTKKTIEIPNYIFQNKQSGPIKIQINAGIFCDHEFVAFIDKSGKIMGYETFDVGFNLGEFSKSIDKEKLFIPDILKIFGHICVLHTFHAILTLTPIILLRSESSPNYAKDLTNLFNTLLPTDYKSEMIIVSNISEEKYKNAKISDVLVLSSLGVIANTPWNQKTLKYETQILAEVLRILDPKMQLAILEGEFEIVLNHASYITEKIKFKSYFEEDLISELNRQFKMQIDRDYLNLLKDIVLFRFKGNVKKIRNRGLANLKESLW